MKLLHLKSKFINRYIVIDKISDFDIFYEKDLSSYSVHIKTNDTITPLAVKTEEPDKIIRDLLTIINTVNNEIIEYNVREED